MKLGWRIPSPRLLHKSSNQIRRAVSKCSLKQIRRSASRLRGKYNAKSCMRSQRSCHGRDFESRDVTSKTHSMSSFQSGIPTKSMKFVMLDHSKASTDSPTPETRQMFFNILVFETGAMRDPATPWNAHRNTTRECNDPDLSNKIRSTMEKVSQPSIFSLFFLIQSNSSSQPSAWDWSLHFFTVPFNAFIPFPTLTSIIRFVDRD